MSVTPAGFRGQLVGIVAGDRGFLLPELTGSATRDEAVEIRAAAHDGHFSSSRTCEIGMTRATGRTHRSYIYMLEATTRR
jgi:D-lactate dehydrogenase